ncbi:PA0069 family radical SAM protein [Hyphobacterium sp. CCMP332]|nr:PA0069 family radical SAM protein [Hyphobacterium sp. CCMP332]
MIRKNIKGRGSDIQLDNPFSTFSYSRDHVEGIDDWEDLNEATSFFKEAPKKILSKNNSPDIPFEWSINPYQGCEHGCVYCYARNSHNYWGFNAGLDFESKILIKEEAPALLKSEFESLKWNPAIVMLSGNTDCYQPVERKLKITRSLLRVFLQYRNPVGIITKNALVSRDADILEELASMNLCKVIFSITSLEESLRQKLEPRTSTIKKKWEAIDHLIAKKIPVGILIGPIIPGLNDHEMPEIIREAGKRGVGSVSYTMIRLNGQLNTLFESWLLRNFPERSDKILSQIRTAHNGNLNDSKFGRRMRGEGEWAETIKKLYKISLNKYLPVVKSFEPDLSKFRRNPNPGLFD